MCARAGSARVIAHGHYAAIVQAARRQRADIDGGAVAWVVLRNRLNASAAGNSRRVGRALAALGAALDFHTREGFAERLLFRELFTRGLTACDDLDPATLGARPSLSHVMAREEAMRLLHRLGLPGIEAGASATGQASSAPVLLEELAVD